MFAKFLPIRQKKKESASEIVADLDAILVQPVFVKVLGKIVEIKPLNVESFLTVMARFSELWDLKEKEIVTPAELVDKYYALISCVTDDLKKSDISKMSQQQVAGLFQIIMETVTGKIHSDEKKKLLVPMSQPTETNPTI